MKRIIAGLLLITSISSFATAVVMERSIIGRSFRSCSYANADLLEVIERLKEQGDVSKIILAKCNKQPSLVNGITAYSQKATIEFRVQSVNGSY